MTGSYAVHACFLSLIPIKPCIVLIADDNTLLAAPQFVPSDDKLTRIGNILQYGTFGGENCYAYGGHKCTAWRNPGGALPCMA